jgi:hypothetical protein
MAISPSKALRCRASVAAGLLALALCGCGQKPGPTPSPSTTPPASTTATPGAEVSYAEITERYQAPVADDQNGWPAIKALLAPTSEGQIPLSERLPNGLDNAADLAYFDKHVLPVVRESFSKPFFLEPHPLLSGRDPLNFFYRDLRGICDLVAERADLLWKAGKGKEALDLLKLPLGLARAMQSRPETVSVNLFSGPSYANAALRRVADWASDNSLKGAELDLARKMLADFRPSYKHITDSISVDFAQFENSIADEPTRTEILGLGMAKPEDIELWKSQLRTLAVDARSLYSLTPEDPQSFNQAVAKMAPPVQGLVGEYPQHSTQQKLAYCTYLATEMALALENHRLGKDKSALDPKQLLDAAFAGDQQAREAAEALLIYTPGKSSENFALTGRGDVFKLAVPEPPVFYQR